MQNKFICSTINTEIFRECLFTPSRQSFFPPVADPCYIMRTFFSPFSTKNCCRNYGRITSHHLTLQLHILVFPFSASPLAFKKNWRFFSCCPFLVKSRENSASVKREETAAILFVEFRAKYMFLLLSNPDLA